MPVECPRCLEMNPDSNFSCPCGYDLSPILRRRLVSTDHRPETGHARVREMSQWSLCVGVALVWLVLSLGEGFRLKFDLASRASSRLVGDSLLIGAADLAGALAAGALTWIGVWILRSSDTRRYRPCPKRTTLSATIIAAGLIFVGRLTPPGVIAQQIV